MYTSVSRTTIPDNRLAHVICNMFTRISIIIGDNQLHIAENGAHPFKGSNITNNCHESNLLIYQVLIFMRQL